MVEDFGRYEALEELARGANGIVYRARDKELDRIVALKALRHREAGPGARERFVREARLAASLDHPNIVRILETGEHEGRMFYTMPLLEGSVLRRAAAARRGLPRPRRRRSRRRPCPWTRGRPPRPQARQHPRRADGVPVVTDFGVARGPDEMRRHRRPASSWARRPTWPPSRRGATPAAADGKADVYSLGVILFELLTGRLPHRGESFVELSASILNDPAPDLAGYDPELAGLVRRCLAKEPRERPGAAELADRLARWGPRRRFRWPIGLSTVAILAAGATLRARSPEPEDGAMIRIASPAGEFWIDRDEAPARAGGYSFLDAVTGCLRQGKRLPTEEEWEAAAGSGCRGMEDRLAEWTATRGRAGEDVRVVRGGNGLDPPERRTVRERMEVAVTKRAPTLGYRCVRAQDPSRTSW